MQKRLSQAEAALASIQFSEVNVAGMNSLSGQSLTGIDHIKQSIRDILLTPVGTRIMRRDYGSLVADLIDQPINGVTTLQLYASVAMALAQWEPRVELNKITQSINTASPGKITITLDLIRHDTSSPESAVIDISLTTGTNS